MKYRKKPVVIDAIQWPGEMEEGDLRIKEVENWCIEMGANPDNLMMMDDGTVLIATLEGEMTANPGDWIIKEPFPTRGREFYPCKPDIFEQTYDKVG